MVETLGRKEALFFEFDWSMVDEPKTAAEFSRACMRLSIGGVPVWHGDDDSEGFEWTWIELAEFLANAWPWLLWEDGFPLGLRGGRILEIQAELAQRWDSKSETVREVEQQELYDYQETHDLSRALQGAILPQIWLVRQGSLYRITSDSLAVEGSVEEVLETLTAVVETLLSRVSAAGDDRSKALLDTWQNRLSVRDELAVEIATGLDPEVSALIEGGRSPAEYWELDSERYILNELTAAARMVSVLPAEDIRAVVAAVRKSPAREVDDIDSLSKEVNTELWPDRPYDQGYVAAVWLRQRFGLDAEDRADPYGLCEGWGIPVEDIALGVATVDAIACWGPRHGPAVFVNSRGKHNRSAAGRRATVAHEIGHLLLDRSGALPLAEVIGGRSPVVVEERARAFAAEFLLPREVAGREVATASDPSKALRRLKWRFRVSGEIVAWQARNSSVALSNVTRTFLRSQVSQPQRF